MARLVNDPRWSAINLDGTPAAGAKLYVYEAGTSTEATIFSSVSENDTNRMTNPLIADGRGCFPVFYCQTGTYDIKIESQNGSPISDVYSLSV